MFGSPFRNSQVTAIARIIHEMCSFSHQLKASGGSFHTYFKTHPMLKSHRAPLPTDIDQIHTFLLSDGRQGFAVLVDEGERTGKGLPDVWSGWIKANVRLWILCITRLGRRADVIPRHIPACRRGSRPSRTSPTGGPKDGPSLTATRHVGERMMWVGTEGWAPQGARTKGWTSSRKSSP